MEYAFLVDHGYIQYSEPGRKASWTVWNIPEFRFPTFPLLLYRLIIFHFILISHSKENEFKTNQ